MEVISEMKKLFLCIIVVGIFNNCILGSDSDKFDSLIADITSSGGFILLEITNESDDIVKDISITITFYDINNKKLFEEKQYLTHLLPGKSSGFTLSRLLEEEGIEKDYHKIIVRISCHKGTGKGDVFTRGELGRADASEVEGSVRSEV